MHNCQPFSTGNLKVPAPSIGQVLDNSFPLLQIQLQAWRRSELNYGRCSSNGKPFLEPGLMVGVLATVLVQSSSTSTSIVATHQRSVFFHLVADSQVTSKTIQCLHVFPECVQNLNSWTSRGHSRHFQLRIGAWRGSTLMQNRFR